MKLKRILTACDEALAYRDYQLATARADIVAKNKQIAELTDENRRLRAQLEDRRPYGHGVDPDAESRECAALTEAYNG